MRKTDLEKLLVKAVAQALGVDADGSEPDRRPVVFHRTARPTPPENERHAA